MSLFSYSLLCGDEEAIKQTGKILLQRILNNEKSFAEDDEKMEDYRMFEDLEAALAGRKAELERRTSELEQSKSEIKTLEEAVKAKDEEFAQFRADSDAEKAKLLADFNTEKAKLLAEIESLKAGQQA